MCVTDKCLESLQSCLFSENKRGRYSGAKSGLLTKYVVTDPASFDRLNSRESFASGAVSSWDDPLEDQIA